jgi:hypothetical protein
MNKIEIVSDEIAMQVEINDVTTEALRTIKSSVLRGRVAVDHCGEEAKLQYVPVLERILDYLNGAVRYPAAVALYAERVATHIENYILLQRPFDEKYEMDRDKEKDVFVEVNRVAARIAEINREKKALVRLEIADGNAAESPEYKLSVLRDKHLETQLNSELFRLENLQKVLRMNDLIRFEDEKARTVADMRQMRTKSYDAYAAEAYNTKAMLEEEEGLFEAFERVAEDVAVPLGRFVLDDRAFRRAI